MFQRRMGQRAAFWGGELFVHRCAIARHSLLVVGQGCGLQPFAACSAAGSTKEQPRSALRLFFASRFARLRGIAAQAKKYGSRQGQRLPGAMLPFRFLTP